MSRCIVVRDGFGDLHADTLDSDENPLDAAKDLVLRYGLSESDNERFEFGVVEECSDPGAARLMPVKNWTTRGSFTGFETRELPSREAFEVIS